MEMNRTCLACAALLVFGSGCTFSARAGGGAGSPEPGRVASEPEHRHRERPHTPARPERVAPDQQGAAQPQPEVQPRPERTRKRPSRTRPDPRPTKLADVEPTRPESRPPIKPEPRPETEPPATTEPKSEVKPKPRPKPEMKPKPEEQGLPGFVFGAPSGLKPGLPDAFWVYQDEQGWHLRTTTDSKKVLHKFTGRIWITEGTFSSAKPSRLEQGQDSVKSTARAIKFSFDTIGVMDGVDWKSIDRQCIHFELLYDGKADAKVIYLGAKKINPPSNVFLICGR